MSRFRRAVRRLLPAVPVLILSALACAAPARAQAPATVHEVQAALRYGAWNDAPAWNAGGARGDEAAAVWQQAARRRSVPLAFGLSAAVPGLGQAYNRQWVKTAVAVAAEVGLVAAYVAWHRQGLDAEDVYKAYAHASWSPARYATWINDFKDYLNQTYPSRPVQAPDVAVPSGIDFTRPDVWTAAEQQAVRALFDAIRRVEDQVYHPETGASFSHNLPYFGEQQYYELIGKYFQFAPGWEDYPAWIEDGAYTGAIDPDASGPGNTKPNIRGRFLDYAARHAEANNLLRRASRASALIVVNHIVAAIDAAIFAKLHNQRLEAGLQLAYGWDGEPLPAARLNLRF